MKRILQRREEGELYESERARECANIVAFVAWQQIWSGNEDGGALYIRKYLSRSHRHYYIHSLCC
jgi:hypothetical protein